MRLKDVTLVAILIIVMCSMIGFGYGSDGTFTGMLVGVTIAIVWVITIVLISFRTKKNSP